MTQPELPGTGETPKDPHIKTDPLTGCRTEYYPDGTVALTWPSSKNLAWAKQQFFRGVEETARQGKRPELLAIMKEGTSVTQAQWDPTTEVSVFLEALPSECTFLQMVIDHQTTCWYASCELFEGSPPAVGFVANDVSRMPSLDILLSNSLPEAASGGIDPLMAEVGSFLNQSE